MARQERRVIKGFPAGDDTWKVTPDARVYHHGHQQPVTKHGSVAAVDLGPKYHGPVQAMGCHPDCPKCSWQTHDHMDWRPDCEMPKEPRFHTPDTLRPLDEIVLHAFHGPPKGDLGYGAYPLYKDGQRWTADGRPNCTKDNLEWGVIENVKKWHERQQFMRYHRLHEPRFNYATVYKLNLQKAAA